MAVSWDILKARYLQTSRSSQLDSLSLNLNLIRLEALAASGAEESVAHHLVRESQFFIEWSVPSINLETHMFLATEAFVSSASAQSVETQMARAMEQRAGAPTNRSYRVALGRTATRKTRRDRWLRIGSHGCLSVVWPKISRRNNFFIFWV